MKINWQEEYEDELAELYVCGITGLPCMNCSPYGCEHRQPNPEIYNSDQK